MVLRFAFACFAILALVGGYTALTNVNAEDKKEQETAVPAESLGSGASIRISVVDIEKILSESKAAKSIKTQVDEKRKGFISEVEKAEKTLRDNQKAIEKESKKLSKEDLMKKAQEFEAKRLEARKSIQIKKSKLDQAYTEAMNELTKSIYDVCQKIADDKKIDLVITRQNIIVGSMSLDITESVLKDLDAALPKLTLKVKD